MLSARFLGNAMKLGEKISLYKGECLLVTMAAGIAAFGVLVQPDLGTAAIIAALVMGTTRSYLQMRSQDSAVRKVRYPHWSV